MYKINKLQHGKRFVRDFHEVISMKAIAMAICAIIVHFST